VSDRRDQQLHFRVSKPELERIRNKMEASGILSIGSYLRKMALDGYCLHAGESNHFVLAEYWCPAW